MPDTLTSAPDSKLRIRLEKILVTGILIGFLFPLTTSVSFIKVVTWNIPGAVLLIWIILRGIEKKRFHLRAFDTWEYSAIAIIIIYTVMTLLGREPIASSLFLFSFLTCYLLAIYFRRVYGSIINNRYLIIFAFITVGLEAVVGLIQQITSSEFGNLSVFVGETPDTTALRSVGETDMGRVHGTLGTGNLVGSWINMFIPFVLFAGIYLKGRRVKLWQYTIGILAIIAILLTISRFNMAIFLGILLFVALLKLYKRKRKRLRTLVNTRTFSYLTILVLLVTITTVIFQDEVGMMKKAIEFRFSDTFEAVESVGQSTSGVAARMEMNKGAIQAFSRSPLIGLGFKNSRWIWPTVDANVPKNWVYQPHNLYMIMLVEGGLFLFLAYCVFTFYPFYRFWLLRNSGDPFLLAYFLSLSAAIGIQMIYITFTSANFGAVYMMIQGLAMGHTDQLLARKERL